MSLTTAQTMALRKLMQARIAIGNSIHELDTLDTLTDDWNTENDSLETTSLEIHLQCEFGAKEATAILEILNSFLSSPSVPEWLWVEIELRQENAVLAAKEIISVIEQLATATANPELGLKEMKRRGQHILAKLEGVKDMAVQLRLETQAGTVEAHKLQQSVAEQGERS